MSGRSLQSRADQSTIVSFLTENAGRKYSNKEISQETGLSMTKVANNSRFMNKEGYLSREVVGVTPHYYVKSDEEKAAITQRREIKPFKEMSKALHPNMVRVLQERDIKIITCHGVGNGLQFDTNYKGLK